MNDVTKYNEQLFRYNTASNKVMRRILIIAFLILLVSFSKLYLPNKITSEDSTPRINESIHFSTNRTATLQSCIYDESQDMIELMLLVSNRNYDGIDDYYYAATGVGNIMFRSKNLKVEEVLNNPICTVIRIHNVRGFDEIEFMMAPQITILNEIKDADTLIVQLNKFNVAAGVIDTNKTERDYSLDRVDITIALLQEEIKGLEEQVKESEETMKALEEENKQIQESKIYMTEAEKVEADEKITSNGSAITSLQNKIKDLMSQIEEANKNLLDAEETKKNITTDT